MTSSLSYYKATSINQLLADGTAALPSLSFSSETASGLYRAGSNDLIWVVNGVKVLELITATTGVNYVKLTPAATGSAPIYAAVGTDSNIGLTYATKGTGEYSFKCGSTEFLHLTTDGRLYGSALHNNSGAVTGTTNQYVGSGTFSPTFTAGTNVDSGSCSTAQWIRTGNVVTVSGQVTVNITTTLLASDGGLSFPIASTTSAAEKCSGTAVGKDTNLNACGNIIADTSNNRAQIKLFGVVGTGDIVYSYTYTYLIS